MLLPVQVGAYQVRFVRLPVSHERLQKRVDYVRRYKENAEYLLVQNRPDRPLTPDAVRSSCFSKREWEIILARWRRDVRLMGERPTIWL